MDVEGKDDTELSGSYLQSFVSMENNFETYAGVANKEVKGTTEAVR